LSSLGANVVLECACSGVAVETERATAWSLVWVGACTLSFITM